MHNLRLKFFLHQLEGGGARPPRPPYGYAYEQLSSPLVAVDCAIQWIRIKWSFKETLNDEVHKVELNVQFLTIDAVVLRLDHREK